MRCMSWSLRMSDERTESAVLVCTGCDREIEHCAFCDERCGHELCYRCVLYELKESLAQPHAHGG
jgi:hypothetical protein